MALNDLVKENYGSYEPPFDVRKTVERLLSGVDPRYLTGLSSVVLSSHQGFNRERRRAKTKSRGRKVAFNRCNGLYWQAWQGKPAWIELFVDGILGSTPKVVHRWQFLRDVELAETLFHELGHHVHATQTREFSEKETVADKWGLRLTVQSLRSLHPRLMRLVLLLLFIPRPVVRWLKSRRLARTV